jgi:hypothetical protein
MGKSLARAQGLLRQFLTRDLPPNEDPLLCIRDGSAAMSDPSDIRITEIAQRHEADDAKRSRYYQLIGELSSLHNEVTGIFSALFSILLGMDWQKANAILKDYRHLDQKVGLIDRIVEFCDETDYVKPHWPAVKKSASSLNSRRGRLIHGAVATLLDDETGISTVTVLAVKLGRTYSEREVQASVNEDEIKELITEYRNLYVFVSIVTQSYALKIGLEEDGESINPDLKEKQHEMLAVQRRKLLPE